MLSQRKVARSGREYVVKQLEANTEYWFDMTATSTHYESDHSNRVIVTTSGNVVAL